MQSEKKFEFHIPSITALDVLKGIFLFVDRSKHYSCNPVKYNKFFQKAASKNSNLFGDIYIDGDPFLPYSEDVERAYSSAMEFNIIQRPNPDVYPCMIVAPVERLKKDVDKKFDAAQAEQLKKLAKDFEAELQEQPNE